MSNKDNHNIQSYGSDSQEARSGSAQPVTDIRPEQSTRQTQQSRPDQHDTRDEDTIIAELLRLACDTKHLDNKTLVEKIETILNTRIENEVMINSLLKVGTQHDKISVEEAAKINSKNKDSIADLVRVKKLLEDGDAALVDNSRHTHITYVWRTDADSNGLHPPTIPAGDPRGHSPV